MIVPALLVSLLAVACPSSEPTPRPTGDALEPTDLPRTGGEVVVAYPHEPATLDPYAPAGLAPATRDLTRLVMPALYRLGPGGARTPWLLASEPVVTEAPRFTVAVTLRDDAVWSDGRPITIEDLRATWRRVMDRDAASRTGYDRIRRIVADSQKRGRIEFRARFDGWRDLFSAGLGVLPAHVLAEGDDGFAHAWEVSGGPFVMTRWRRGLDVVFEPNPRAWGNDEPRIDRLRVVFVPDAIGARELLRRGDVDVLGPYHAADWQHRVAEVPDVALSADTGTTAAALLVDPSAGPFARARVRRALADAIDRGRLGAGLVQDDGSALQSLTPDEPDGGFRRYGDAARARRTLNAAGWRDGMPRTRNGSSLEGTLALAGDELGGVLVRAIQFQARAVGFDLQAVPLDTRQLWDEWLGGAELELAFVIVRAPDLAVLLDRIGTDRPNDLVRDVPILPLARLAVVLAARARVVGVCASAAADGPFWNAHAWLVDVPAERAPACPSALPAAA